MGSSSKPKTPDYTKTAIAQGEQDRLTAQYLTEANRPNQYSPYGSVTWDKAPTAELQDINKQLEYWNAQAQGKSRKETNAIWDKYMKPLDTQKKKLESSGGYDWTQRTTLTPQEQAIFDQDQSNRLLLQQLGAQVGQQAQGTLGQAFNPNLTSFGQLGDWKGSSVGLPQADFQSLESLLPGGNLRDLEGRVPTSNLRDLEGRLPQNTLTGLQDVAESAGAFQAQGDQVRDALYQQLTRFNQDRFGRAEESERTRLANQGFQVGTQAYDNAMREFNRSRNEAYDSAGLQSVLAGGQEQSRLLADQLGARASNIGLRQGQYDQNMGNLQALSGLRQGQFNQDLTGLQALTGLRQGQFEQDMSRVNNMAGLRGQQFDADSSRYQLGLGERQAEAGYNLNRNNQLAQQRAQEFSEQSYLRNLPINEISALMSGGGVGMPQMPGFNQATQYASPDLMGAANANFQSKLSNYNAGQAGQGQWMSLLGTLGGGYLGGPGGAAAGSYLGSLFG